jgi:hypothetical protein
LNFALNYEYSKSLNSNSYISSIVKFVNFNVKLSNIVFKMNNTKKENPIQIFRFFERKTSSNIFPRNWSIKWIICIGKQLFSYSIMILTKLFFIKSNWIEYRKWIILTLKISFKYCHSFSIEEFLVLDTTLWCYKWIISIVESIILFEYCFRIQQTFFSPYVISYYIRTEWSSVRIWFYSSTIIFAMIKSLIELVIIDYSVHE